MRNRLCWIAALPVGAGCWQEGTKLFRTRFPRRAVRSWGSDQGGVSCQNSDWEFPSSFSPPRCRRPDLRSRRAVDTEVAMAVAMAVVTAVVTMAAVITAAVMATRISVVVTTAAGTSAGRRIPVHSPATACEPRALAAP